MINNETRSVSPAPNTQPEVTLLDIDETLKILLDQIKQNQSMLNAKIDVTVAKLTTENADLSAKLDEVTSRVNSLIDAKLATLQSDLRVEFTQQLDHHVKELTALQTANMDLQSTCLALSTRLDELSQRTDESLSNYADQTKKSELAEKANDIIVRGIPWVQGENCRKIFEKVALSIGYTAETTPSAVAFRLGTKKTGAKFDPPILIRFNNRNEKSGFFKNYLGKLSLNLSDIGFELNTRIYLSENLTVANQKIFQAAMAMKRECKLIAVKTKFGTVVIQRTAKDLPTPIRRLSDL
jgi:hypothetical protein